MRIAKTEPARKSYALYTPSTPAKYAVLDDAGSVVGRIVGRAGHAGIVSWRVVGPSGERIEALDYGMKFAEAQRRALAHFQGTQQ